MRARVIDIGVSLTNGSAMSTRNIIITGANTGIGKATALALAKIPGVHLFLACRSQSATKPVLDEMGGGVKAEWLALDLSDLSSVRTAARTFRDKKIPLHVLINNAGLAGKKDLTKDGFEIAFGVNHLGHFLFTQLLIDLFEGTADEPARIVNVASGSHYQAKEIVWENLRKPAQSLTAMEAYEVSKLCNVLYTKSLAEKYKGKHIHSYSLHPGTVASEAWREIPRPIAWVMKRFMKSTQEGARASIHCATSDAAKNETGLFYWENAKVREPNRLVHDRGLQEELWRRSVEWAQL